MAVGPIDFTDWFGHDLEVDTFDDQEWVVKGIYGENRASAVGDKAVSQDKPSENAQRGKEE